MPLDRYIIVDLEATCWRERAGIERMETIEVGAVRVVPGTWVAGDEFHAYVRPVGEPVLSEFCVELTGVRQEDVEAAETFPAVLRRFLDWAGPEPFTWGSWGRYDYRQIEADCRRHALPFPTALQRHINIKQEFADHHSRKPCGMAQALEIAGLPLLGRHHSALDDARNIARLAATIHGPPRAGTRAAT